MKVMKFGGTSVGSPERIKEVAKLITKGKKDIVVLSAMSGTTNSLVEIADYYYKGNKEGAGEIINNLRKKYFQHVEELYTTEEMKEKTKKFLNSVFTRLLTFDKGTFTTDDEKEILSKGEIMSTNMMTNYLNEQGINAVLLSAFTFMRIDRNSEPEFGYLCDNLTSLLEQEKDADLYITQGYICLNHEDKIDNLKRGGSDYSASLIGAAINADEIQIWTDIDGMHNNDPRIVDKTKAIHQLNFEEAAELAYFGAKILHPTCVQPAKSAGVPVKLLNTMDPEAEGTVINNDMQPNKIKAVAAKDNITAIKIVSTHMLLATGFLRKVFEIFETYNTSIDLITTSEVGVSMSIDDTSKLSDIVNELKKYGIVEVDKDMCIICVVGDLRSQNTGFESAITNALKEIPIRMISYGGSNHNISFLIHESDKTKALQALNNEILNVN
ncbi:MAG: aspartate kinase [Prevotellaceae bacterium]|nr:aspartate kinase [Candidatus Faecinaster equi]